MNECPDVTGQWGKPCPTCNVTLPPKPGPLTSWKAEREARLGREEFSRKVTARRPRCGHEFRVGRFCTEVVGHKNGHRDKVKVRAA